MKELSSVQRVPDAVKNPKDMGIFFNFTVLSFNFFTIIPLCNTKKYI